MRLFAQQTNYYNVPISNDCRGASCMRPLKMCRYSVWRADMESAPTNSVYFLFAFLIGGQYKAIKSVNTLHLQRCKAVQQMQCKVYKNNKSFSNKITKLCKTGKKSLTNFHFVVQYKVGENSMRRDNSIPFSAYPSKGVYYVKNYCYYFR